MFQRQDFELAIPLGGPDQKPVFAIKVVVSSVLLRAMVWPQVRNIGLILLGSLLASALLAVVVSNLALRPLDSISRAIDRISRGEFGKPVALAEGGAKEFSVVQSKLNLLGQQFRGAREDATQLRSNIERLLEKLEEVVLLFDRDDRLVMAGRAAERLLGRGRWEIVGRSLAELFPPSTALGGAVESALQLRQPLRDHPLTLERDGLPPARVLVSVETLEGFPKKERRGTLVTLRDAETRREIQSHLDVSARLAAISRLTEGVAHEIKNPLNAIAVHLEVLRSKLADSSQVDPEIQTIAREIIRLDRVVKTFLDFTRPLDLKMRELDLVALAREVAGLVGPSARAAARSDRTGGGACRGVPPRRSRPAPADHPQRGGQRGRSHERRRAPSNPGPAAGRRMRAGRLRRGRRDCAGNPRQHLQPLLQHQGQRLGHRPGDDVPRGAIA